ncbi:GH23009 [Drosophila grimshawi]|uniref:GH23009 n=1 Tax=Drosophila grimshawi TaxID=7222 RepID=B4JWB8_DROGR|nr:GH23009 [Drosophila grimshawi]
MDTVSADAHGLVSKGGQASQLALPRIERITDVRQFMKESQNFNGSIEKLTKFIENQEQQCEDIKMLLKQQVQLQMDTLHQVKEDILELQRQLREPGQGQTKILVKFLDETEVNEYETMDALARYNIKMSSLYGEILALDSDVDYVSYLASVARLNKEYVLEWHKREKLQKPKLAKIKDKTG